MGKHGGLFEGKGGTKVEALSVLLCHEAWFRKRGRERKKEERYCREEEMKRWKGGKKEGGVWEGS